MDIIPAIMPSTYDDLVAKASRIRGLTRIAQIDIMDGMFVASKSWPYTEGGTRNEKHFAMLSMQEEGMPFWEELDYELDLMIAHPEDHIDEWIPLGASRLIFHVESIGDEESFWGHAIFTSGAREIAGQKIIEVGLAVNPDTPLEAVTRFLSDSASQGKIDFIQCMGITKIGYQGQAFDERVLAHVNTLRVRYPNLPISVDGGVNHETAKLLKDAGATRLVSGSALFGSGDIATALEALRGV